MSSGWVGGPLGVCERVGWCKRDGLKGSTSLDCVRHDVCSMFRKPACPLLALDLLPAPHDHLCGRLKKTKGLHRRRSALALSGSTTCASLDPCTFNPIPPFSSKQLDRLLITTHHHHCSARMCSCRQPSLCEHPTQSPRQQSAKQPRRHRVCSTKRSGTRRPTSCCRPCA